MISLNVLKRVKLLGLFGYFFAEILRSRLPEFPGTAMRMR
jgi:hypothetical protein